MGWGQSKYMAAEADLRRANDELYKSAKACASISPPDREQDALLSALAAAVDRVTGAREALVEAEVSGRPGHQGVFIP